MYIFVDLVKHSVLTLVGEKLCYISHQMIAVSSGSTNLTELYPSISLFGYFCSSTCIVYIIGSNKGD